MSAALPGFNEQQTAALQELAELRSFAGPPKEFWPRYLKSLAGLTSGSKAMLLVQDPAQAAAWKRVSEWPTDLGPSRALAAFHGQLDMLAADCVKLGGGLLALLEASPRVSGHYVVAVRLRFHRAPDIAVVTLLLSEVSESSAREALFRVRLAADAPESYQMHQA